MPIPSALRLNAPRHSQWLQRLRPSPSGWPTSSNMSQWRSTMPGRDSSGTGSGRGSVPATLRAAGTGPTIRLKMAVAQPALVVRLLFPRTSGCRSRAFTPPAVPCPVWISSSPPRHQPGTSRRWPVPLGHLPSARIYDQLPRWRLDRSLGDTEQTGSEEAKLSGEIVFGEAMLV